MWRIGQLARMVGVSDRTLRHYDAIGLLDPATVDASTSYRWYGVAELTRLERIRALQHLGLSLRQITTVLDDPDAHLRHALVDTVTALRADIDAKSAVLSVAEEQLTSTRVVLPQRATVGARRLRVRHLHVDHPSELAELCSTGSTTLLTWLREPPTGGFAAAVTTAAEGDLLTLPEREVVRAAVPTAHDLARAGGDLFDWVTRHQLVPDGPTVEDHLVDARGDRVTMLEIPVRQAGPLSPGAAGAS